MTCALASLSQYAEEMRTQGAQWPSPLDNRLRNSILDFPSCAFSPHLHLARPPGIVASTSSGSNNAGDATWMRVSSPPTLSASPPDQETTPRCFLLSGQQSSSCSYSHQTQLRVPPVLLNEMKGSNGHQPARQPANLPRSMWRSNFDCHGARPASAPGACRPDPASLPPMLAGILVRVAGRACPLGQHGLDAFS